MTARPDIEGVKAMLVDAVQASTYFGIVGRRANTIAFAHPGQYASAGIDSDKLAATVSEWFAAHYEAPTRLTFDGKGFRLTNEPEPKPPRLSGAMLQLSQPLGTEGGWLTDPVTVKAVKAAMTKAVEAKRAAYAIPLGFDLMDGMNALPADYKEWEPGDTKRWFNDWGWRLTACDSVTGDMPHYPPFPVRAAADRQDGGDQ